MIFWDDFLRVTLVNRHTLRFILNCTSNTIKPKKGGQEKDASKEKNKYYSWNNPNSHSTICRSTAVHCFFHSEYRNEAPPGMKHWFWGRRRTISVFVYCQSIFSLTSDLCYELKLWLVEKWTEKKSFKTFLLFCIWSLNQSAFFISLT